MIIFHPHGPLLSDAGHLERASTLSSKSSNETWLGPSLLLFPLWLHRATSNFDSTLSAPPSRFFFFYARSAFYTFSKGIMKSNYEISVRRDFRKISRGLSRPSSGSTSGFRQSWTCLQSITSALPLCQKLGTANNIVRQVSTHSNALERWRFKRHKMTPFLEFCKPHLPQNYRNPKKSSHTSSMEFNKHRPR